MIKLTTLMILRKKAIVKAIEWEIFAAFDHYCEFFYKQVDCSYLNSCLC